MLRGRSTHLCARIANQILVVFGYARSRYEVTLGGPEIDRRGVRVDRRRVHARTRLPSATNSGRIEMAGGRESGAGYQPRRVSGLVERIQRSSADAVGRNRVPAEPNSIDGRGTGAGGASAARNCDRRV